MGAGVGREGGARGARLWRAGRSAAGGGDAAASDLQIKGEVPKMVRAAQASPDHGFCGFRAERAGDPSCLELD